MSFNKAKATNPGPSWILHSRKFKENSLICDILTKENGKISVIINNTNSKKKRQLLQPFQELWLEYQPTSSFLNKVIAIEPGKISYNLLNTKSICGLYINELILKTTASSEHLPIIFPSYTICLKELYEYTNPAYALRNFEKTLLQALGYGIAFEKALNSEGKNFLYHQEKGFIVTSETSNISFNKQQIKLIQQGQWEKPKINNLAKILFSTALGYILNNKPIRCKEIIQGIMS